MYGRLLATVSALALSACATGPSYKVPEVKAEDVKPLVVTGRAPNYNRSDAQNSMLVSKAFNNVLSAAGPVCDQAKINCGAFSVEYNPDKTVNAYASLSTRVTMFAGLANRMDETQIAAVLAHEIGHHIARHNQSTEQRATVGNILGRIAGIGIGIATRTDPNITGDLGALAGVLAGVVPFSKRQEQEADLIGMYLLHRAGYDLTKARQTWMTLAQISAEDKGRAGGNNNQRISSPLATHPTNAEREAAWETRKEEVLNSKTGLPRLSSQPAPH